MVGRGTREAMAELENWEAMAGLETREAMAGLETRGALAWLFFQEGLIEEP